MTHDFQYVQNMVNALRATSSTKEKEDIIKINCGIFNNPSAAFTKKVLLYTYHPLWQYNVTSDNLKKKNHLEGQKYYDIFTLLNDLRDRVITGHDAIGAVNCFINIYPDYEELIHCIIDKDLKTRAGDKIINKAIPDHIPEFSVALADKYESKIIDWKDGWYVSRKIDGARCIAVVDNNGDTSFYSRTGKSFETLGVISDNIKVLGVTNVVFDGELCLLDEDGNEDFQGIMKQLKKKDHTIAKPSYKIFDMVTHDEFFSKKGEKNRPYSIRYQNLLEIMKKNECDCLSVLNQDLVNNDTEFKKLQEQAVQNNWEGLMLRSDAPYKGKRSKDLLKYKNFQDAEYEVIATSYGPFRYIKDGKEHEEVMMSNITIRHKDHNVDVGSGFTIEERKHYYKNPEDIIDKVVTIQYFEETYNQEGGISLRFPTFKFLHGDKRDS